MVQRKQKISIKPGKSREPLAITHPNAAGVDIGSSSHYVSVPPDRDDEPVREFPSFTVDKHGFPEDSSTSYCGLRLLLKFIARQP